MNDKTSSIIVLNRWGTRAAYWYLGNTPNEMTAGWTQDVNGIASDEYNSWLITNADLIFKFPINHISNNNYTKSAVMPPALRDRGCDHYGDPDAFNGYLFVPVTGCDGPWPLLAVFRASDLSLVCYDELFQQHDAGWVAIDPRTGNLVSSDKSLNSSEPLVIYTVNWSKIVPDPNPRWFLRPTGEDLPTVLNRSGLPIDLKHMQGGDFNDDGSLP